MERQLTVWTETTAGQVVGQVRADINGVETAIVPLTVAAAHLGFSERHVRHLCEAGQLIAIKMTGCWWILQKEILSYPIAGVQ